MSGLSDDAMGRFLRKARIWAAEYRRRRERCAWCGWYPHPNLVFGVKGMPQVMASWKEPSGEFVCAGCHYLNARLRTE